MATERVARSVRRRASSRRLRPRAGTLLGAVAVCRANDDAVVGYYTLEPGTATANDEIASYAGSCSSSETKDACGLGSSCSLPTSLSSSPI